MKIVIDLDEYQIEHCKRHVKENYANLLEEAIANGTPIPKNYGRLIDADKLLYEDIECTDGRTYMVVNAYDVDNAPTIIEADKGEEE